MNKKLVHPFWVHFGAVAAFIAFIIVLFSGEIPSEAPVHFTGGGAPERYGSPWESFGLTIGLSVLFLIVSSIIDELWARQEKSKKFNWLTPLDDIVVGALVGIDLGYLSFLRSGDTLFSFPWAWVAIAVGGSLVLSIILEYLRPYRSFRNTVDAREDNAIKDQLVRYIESNRSFVYWDYQNPLYVSLLTIILPVVLVAAGIATVFSEPWAAVILIVVGLLLVVPYGGQRTMVTRNELTVRWGVFGLKVLQLRISDITANELHEFAPLRDFGGYGIRFNREMKAYYMRGSLGVKITMNDGKKYLIGSDRPRQLAAVLETLKSAS